MGKWLGAFIALSAVLVVTSTLPATRTQQTPPPTTAATGAYFPEPYDFHYPDEGIYPAIADAVRISATLGESASSTFVEVPATAGTIEVTTDDLVGPDGATLPKEFLDVGVVMFMDRRRESHYLQNISLRGGINQEVRQHEPVVPMVIVPDERDFLANTAAATGSIKLRTGTGTTAIARPGKGTQFWVTAHIPATFAPPAQLTTYRGSLTMRVDGATEAVPIEVTVLRTALDELSSGSRFVGVFQTFDQFDPSFRDAVMADLRQHGVNAVFQRGATVADYEYFRAGGITTVINADNLDATAQQIKNIAATGFPPLFYGHDEPNRNNTVPQQVSATNAIHSRGGLIGTSGNLQALQQVDARAPQDWWNLSFAISWQADDPTFRHLDDVRADPRNKIAGLETVYPMTLLDLYPLETRLLYGLWLYASNLDGGLAWAYANDARNVNPYTLTDWNGVAFPAEFHDASGALVRREILPSYVWEAFRDGVTDMRYALTVDRLLTQRGTPPERQRFTQLLDSYRQLFTGNESTRIDVRNPNAAVRTTRAQLFTLLTELTARAS